MIILLLFSITINVLLLFLLFLSFLFNLFAAYDKNELKFNSIEEEMNYYIEHDK